MCKIVQKVIDYCNKYYKNEGIKQRYTKVTSRRPKAFPVDPIEPNEYGTTLPSAEDYPAQGRDGRVM